jgi:glucose-1-phosphate adenylyltransferase
MIVSPSDVLSVILGGGQGTRLFPLTRDRAKPAVPLAGKYRLVDIPISNCINSGLRRIYLLTQFNSASLHRHVSQSYKFDQFTGGFVEILAAHQTLAEEMTETLQASAAQESALAQQNPPSQPAAASQQTLSAGWYEGTADAVRRNKDHIFNHTGQYVLVLSGDQLYRMDFRVPPPMGPRSILTQHVETNAELTIATLPVRRDAASSLGIMQIDAERRITRFVEKPKAPELLDSLHLDPSWHGPLGVKGEGEFLLASMGIYVFNRDLLKKLLQSHDADFGKHLIPRAIGNHRVYSYIFQGHWEDIGTIRSFFEANLDLVSELPRFNFFDTAAPIFSRPRWLPGSKINGAAIDHAMICDGCIITRAQISHSVVGIRSIVGAGSRLMRTVMMGCDYYELLDSILEHEAKGEPRMGIGNDCRIENAIIDKNARIGKNVVISPAGKPQNMDGRLPKVKGIAYYIRDGIVIIPKNGVVPDNTVI